MNDAISLAVDLAFNLSLQMVTWAAGFIVFLAGVLAEAVQGFPVQKWLLRMALAGYAISILAGMISLSIIIGNLTDPTLDGSSFQAVVPGAARGAVTVQFTLFCLATLFCGGIAMVRAAKGVGLKK